MRTLLVAAVLPLARPYALTTPARTPVACRRCASAPLLDATAESETALSMPPESFQILLENAAASTDAAIADGQNLIEVEFPPLPVSKLEDSSLSAYDILSANLQFALTYIKQLEKKADGSPRKVALTLPDASERSRALQFFGDEEPWPGTKLWSLNGGDKAADEGFMALFGSAFKQGSGAVVAAEWADMHLIIGASCQELPAIQKLAELSPSTPLVCFNLKVRARMRALRAVVARRHMSRAISASAAAFATHVYCANAHHVCVCVCYHSWTCCAAIWGFPPFPRRTCTTTSSRV